MTDRYHTLTVTLEQDIRSDDAEFLINAIKALRYVADVKGVVADMESHMAQTRAKQELRNKLWEVLK